MCFAHCNNKRTRFRMNKKIIDIVTGNINQKQKEEILSGIESKGGEEKQAYEKIKTAWALASSSKEISEYDLERLYLEFQSRKNQENKNNSSSLNSLFKYAAIAIIILGITAIIGINKRSDNSLISENQEPEVTYTTIETDHGQVSKVILPDGSIVWLNSETKLSYNNNYSISNRDLQLNGHAYLEVTKNEDIPLVVSCNDLQVKVLGTKFDVNAYSFEDQFEIVLESGSVELLNTDDELFNYFLKPGELAEYDKESKDVDILEVDVSKLAMWREGYLLFDNTPMEDVIKKLELSFETDVIVKDPGVYKSVFNATFKDEGLKEILDFIEYSCPISYKLIKDHNLNKSIVELYYNPEKID